jgi:hypothetical protein
MLVLLIVLVGTLMWFGLGAQEERPRSRPTPVRR